MAENKPNKDYMFGYDYRPSASIWPVECSRLLPETTEFDCFDITPSQFPPQEWLPKNIHLHLHDAFESFPAEFQGKFDLVNFRCFVCIVKNDDPSKLLGNIVALLKPGGFVQWTEADPDSLRVIAPEDRSKSYEAVQKMYDFMATPRPNLRYTWIPTLDVHMKQTGLMAVELEKHTIRPELESFHNMLKFLTCEEAICLTPNITSEQVGVFQKQLAEGYAETRNSGAGLTSGFVLALGKKMILEK